MKNIFFSCAVCLVLTFYTNICIKLEFNTSDRLLCLLLISSICKNSQRNLMIRKMLVRGPRTSVCSKAGKKYLEVSCVDGGSSTVEPTNPSKILVQEFMVCSKR